MGKHRKQLKRDWQSIEIDLAFALSGGIAAKDMDAELLTETADDNFIATSLEATYTCTLEQGAEPNTLANIAFGVAKSDYSAAEIEAWYENSSGFKRENLIAAEISSRHIKQIGIMSPRAVNAAQQVVTTINEGMPIKTRLNWRILEDTTLAFWIYNGGDVAILALANQVFSVSGSLKGFWED